MGTLFKAFCISAKLSAIALAAIVGVYAVAILSVVAFYGLLQILSLFR